jgi:carboxyl-terminal processing protease
MQQQPRLPLWFLLVNWALILSAFILGSYLGGSSSSRLPDPQRSALEIVFQEVLDSHVEPPDQHVLLERAISGMVKGLDEYSRYIPPTDVPNYDERSSGQYEGIGAKIFTHDDAVIIHFPFTKGPAEAAGLQPGDRLLAVDGELLDTKEERRTVAQLIRGPANSTVKLTIERGQRELDIDVERSSVQRPCVKWAHMIDSAKGLGYLHLSDFHPTAAIQVIEAIEALEKDSPLRGLIIDLRYDGGGSLDQCLSIARAFLPTGIIATQIRRGGEEETVYRAHEVECRWPDLPLVILVNEGSASASEVLSGALQDHDRAIIVGTRTHGKGYVNTVYSWRGFDFKLKLTTGSYRTPDGRNIERNHTTNATPADKDKGGIFPDVEVAVTDDQAATIIAVLRNSIEPPGKHLEAYRAIAKKYDFEVEGPPQIATDPQFAMAVDELKKRVGDH